MASASLLSTALIAGMVAAFNPCGFAMLPAYLAYFVGADSDQPTNRAKNIFRAIAVGLTMSLSFLLLFGVFGALASGLISQGSVQEYLQWATFILGILLVPLGVWMLMGHEVNLRIPRLDRGGASTNLPSIFMFGLSFAVVSLGCTAPVFFATVVGSFSSEGWFQGTQVFIAYGAGMASIVLLLTLATGLAKTEIAVLMRKILPYIGRISGGFLVLTGVFLTIYGWWEIQVQRGNISTNWLVDTATEFQNSISNWIAEVGATRLSIVAALWIIGILVWAITSTEQGRAAEKDDAENLKMWRAGAVGSLGLTWLALEIFRYDWGLMILPVYNTVIDLPFRIWGWVSDPFRWSVPFEILFAAFAAAIIILRARITRQKAHQKETQPQPIDA